MEPAFVDPSRTCSRDLEGLKTASRRHFGCVEIIIWTKTALVHGILEAVEWLDVIVLTKSNVVRIPKIEIVDVEIIWW